MTNKGEVRRPGLGNQSRIRHGPSARGDPSIRGKPPFKECAGTKMREYINVPIRGKPPSGVGVSNFNITDFESPPPDTVIPSNLSRIFGRVEGSRAREPGFDSLLSCYLRFPLGGIPEGKGASDWLHRKSRVYVAKKSVGFFGVFIPNRECFALN
jgi:hypothetical protein